MAERRAEVSGKAQKNLAPAFVLGNVGGGPRAHRSM